MFLLGLIEKTGAPSVEVAKSMIENGFHDYEEYREAVKKGATSKKDFLLLQETGAPSIEVAQKVKDGGFPDFASYVEAKAAGFESLKAYQLFRERSQVLETMAKRTKRIAIDDFMEMMKFDNRRVLLDWLYSLPEGIMLMLDGDFIAFNTESIVDDTLSSEIDDLMQRFTEFEKEKRGKI